VVYKRNLSNSHKHWLIRVHNDVSWNFSIGLNERTTLSSKRGSHTTINFRNGAKIASEQPFYLLLCRDENTACNHKNTRIIMAYTPCNQLGGSTQNTSSQSDGTKYLIQLLGKVVLHIDKTI